MSKIERGVKRRCGSCEAPFYDMLRYPITCPKCGVVYDGAAGKKKLASVPRAPMGSAGKAAFGAGGIAAPKTAPKDAVAAPAIVAAAEADDDSDLDDDETEDIDDTEEDEAEDDEDDDDGGDKVTGGH